MKIVSFFIVVVMTYLNVTSGESTTTTTSPSITTTETLWENNQENLAKLVKIADEISKKFPRSRLYGLGHSSSWLIKTMKILNDVRPIVDQTYHHVPFSGSFATRRGLGMYEIDLEGDSCVAPSADQLKDYKKLLDKLGLNPTEIMTQYRNENRRTVIIDFTETGRSLASFLYVLIKWGEDLGLQLEDALQVGNLVQCKTGSSMTYIYINGKRSLSFCQNIELDRDSLVMLACGVDDGPNSDRIVPYYPFSSWSLPIDQFELNNLSENERVQRIIDLLTKFITTNYPCCLRTVNYNPRIQKRNVDQLLCGKDQVYLNYYTIRKISEDDSTKKLKEQYCKDTCMLEMDYKRNVTKVIVKPNDKTGARKIQKLNLTEKNLHKTKKYVVKKLCQTFYAHLDIFVLIYCKYLGY